MTLIGIVSILALVSLLLSISILIRFVLPKDKSKYIPQTYTLYIKELENQTKLLELRDKRLVKENKDLESNVDALWEDTLKLKFDNEELKKKLDNENS
jgi:hypothetical protein